MKLKLDENLGKRCVELLVEDGTRACYRAEPS